MKKHTSIIAIMAVILFGLLIMAFGPVKERVAAPEWRIDMAHSSVSFEVNHFFTPVDGRFNEFEMKFSFDPEDLSTSSVQTTINVESIYTAHERRDGDLKSDNFFDAEKHPQIKFVSTSFEKKGSEYIVNGDLTIKETTKTVSIPFQVLGTIDHPRREGTLVMGLKGDVTINRLDYGVGTGDWIRTNVVGNEVQVSIMIEASRKK